MVKPKVCFSDFDPRYTIAHQALAAVGEKFISLEECGKYDGADTYLIPLDDNLFIVVTQKSLTAELLDIVEGKKEDIIDWYRYHWTKER